MMKKYMIAALAAAGCWAGAAQAAPTITFTAGGSGTPMGETLVQGFDTAATPVGSQVQPGVYVEATSIPGLAVRPTGASGNYAAVTANSTYSITFAQATPVFSFVLGTLDAYNSVIVSFAGDGMQRYDGLALTGGMGTILGDGLVTYSSNGGPFFSGVSFLSTGANSFEIDTISAAVPEPAAWGMMILGFGLAGSMLRRRSTGKLRLA